MEVILKRIAELREDHPGMNCYLLALILHQEFKGTVFYDVDHVITGIEPHGFFDMGGEAEFKEGMIPLWEYGRSEKKSLIDSIYSYHQLQKSPYKNHP